MRGSRAEGGVERPDPGALGGRKLPSGGVARRGVGCPGAPAGAPASSDPRHHGISLLGGLGQEQGSAEVKAPRAGPQGHAPNRLPPLRCVTLGKIAILLGLKVLICNVGPSSQQGGLRSERGFCLAHSTWSVVA